MNNIDTKKITTTALIVVVIAIIIGGIFYFSNHKNSGVISMTAPQDQVDACLAKTGKEKDSCLRSLVEQTNDPSLCSKFDSADQQKACEKFISSGNGEGSAGIPPPPDNGGGTVVVPPQPPVTGQAITDIGVKYGPDPKQDLDVYSNTGFHNAPIAILVHGGSWTMGSKGDMTAIATKAFYPEGFVTIPIDYRLMNTDTLQNDWPTGLNDVACAVAWAKANASKYGGDPNKVVLYGQSAGSHLTSMIAYDPEGGWLSGCQTQGQNLNVIGFMGSGGVYDFTKVRADQRWQPGCLLEQYLGLNSCGPRDSSWGNADPSKLLAASAVGHINAGDPKALIINGDADCYVNYPDPGTGLCDANSVSLANALKSVGVPYTLYTLHGYAHGDFKEAFGKNPSDFPEAINFIKQFSTQ